MGEVRQTNFRVDQDTADKFREFCAAAGMNQAQGFDHVMQVLELDRAKKRCQAGQQRLRNMKCTLRRL